MKQYRNLFIFLLLGIATVEVSRYLLSFDKVFLIIFWITALYFSVETLIILLCWNWKIRNFLTWSKILQLHELVKFQHLPQATANFIEPIEPPLVLPMLTSDFISFHRSSGFYGAETSCNFSSWCFGYFYGNAKFDPLVDSAPSGIYYWEYRAIPPQSAKTLRQSDSRGTFETTQRDGWQSKYRNLMVNLWTFSKFCFNNVVFFSNDRKFDSGTLMHALDFENGVIF